MYIGVEVGATGSVTIAGRVFAINPNGSSKWTFATPDWVDSAPAVGSDGTVYFGCWDGKLYAVTATGSRKWTYSTNGYIVSSPAIGSDGTIYIGSGDGNLHAVNPDGTGKWKFPTGDWVDSSPAIGPDGTIYVGSWDDKLYAITPDGTEKWSYQTGGDIVGSPAIAADGTVYIGSRDGALYAFDSAGVPKWRLLTGFLIDSSPTLASDGTIYVTTTGGRVLATNPDGSERWIYPRLGQTALQPMYSSAAVRSDGSIVVGTSNNLLLALKSDGTLLWQRTLGDYADSSPAVGPDGSIYVGCYDKKLYAFNGNSPAPLTDWPQFHRDAVRDGQQFFGRVSGATGRLVNLSVRTQVTAGADPLIVGYFVAGAGSRSLLVRGVGPTLQNYGVNTFLAAPKLRVFSNGSVIAENSAWGADNPTQIGATAASVGAFPLQVGSADCAIVRDFPAGFSAAAHLLPGSMSGIGLVEVYDAGGAADARLINLSARSFTGTGADVLIVGFAIDGGPRTVLVRGIGPKLAEYGVSGVLGDPFLRLYRGDGTAIAENNDWGTSSNPAVLTEAGTSVAAFPLGSSTKDSILLMTLPAGSYSAQISGVGATTGAALVEVYEIK